MTSDEAKAILTPQRTYTEVEHVHAMYKFLLDQIQSDLASVHFKLKDGRITAEIALEELRSIIYPEGGKYETWYENTGFFNDWWTPEQLREIAEHEEHGGDCTAVPATCTRCMIDEYYGVDTVSWKGKGEGWKIFTAAHPLPAS